MLINRQPNVDNWYQVTSMFKFNSLLLTALLLVPTLAASVARREDPQGCADLLPDFSALPNTTSSGKFMILVNIQAVEGGEARLEEVLENIQAFVATGAEPDTLTYRPTRVVDDNGNPTGAYVSIEEYTDKSALVAHLRSPAGCQFLRESPTLIASQTITVVDEF
ncbi:hypothetical protein D9758_011898 [Tetrapyrgos nigripes]|uniref:ABM domain-containing protein n=1 Tax=Tetrapyrgos nigripes TaxID=182062 RepID=A0A8H5CSC2_9AGAR|nr:hypothetical protein D9758_011898 [Tetrapyrgos nigripes]